MNAVKLQFFKAASEGLFVSWFVVFFRKLFMYRLFFATAMLFSLGVFAQPNKPGAGFAIEANMRAGKIYKHTENFKPPVPDLSTAFELNFLQQTYGKKDWQQRRNYPVVGVGLTYTDYGIDSIFGKCYSIYPVLQLPVLKGGKFEWTFRAGFGIAYVTKRYERAPSWDTLNNVIGSHLNNYTMFATDFRYHINEHIAFQLGAGFSHVSNASLRKPNLGINFYGAHIGLRYSPVTSNPNRIIRNLPRLKNRWLAQFRIGMSCIEDGNGDGPMYPIYIFSAYASKRYNGKNKLLAGIDYSYHEGIYAFLRNNEILTGEERQHSWKSSVFIGNEFIIGKFGVWLQIGYYIREAYLRLDPFYQKLGANVYFLQNEKRLIKEAAIGVLLKTHKTQAEFAEFGLTFGF